MAIATESMEQQAINTIRTLSMDGVQQANSGHPGTPMALAPVMYVLWNEFLRYDPEHPRWPGRDRFILSCGHASMLLYATLHLSGVRKVDPATGEPTHQLAITLDDIKRFRQLHSPCAGHPEFGEAEGIETTTGPLGQGVGNSVGMAIAGQWLAARYNLPNLQLFPFRVFAFCSDGDLMEGVGAEAASLAGHLRLNNLCWIYDDNHITIEGPTELAFSEDVARRFEGLGWKAVRVDDANDLEALRRAFQQFEQTSDRPTIIIVRSIIGYGAPNKANTHAAHGAPLGEEEVRLAKRFYGWPEDAKFLVPEAVREHFRSSLGKRGAQLYRAWNEQYARLQSERPDLAAELQTMFARRLPDGWQQAIPQFAADPKGLATRVSSGNVLNALAKRIPWLIGGSADLAPSTMTLLEHEGHFSATDRSGRNLHFGVREHAMASACNGMALVGLRPYAATFFVFTDYLRPSLRLSAMMRQRVLYILTHDSIGLGEDGPTHQPVEHLAACRAIPGLVVIRPADANEVAEAYRWALESAEGPVALVLTRQNVPTLDRTRYASAAGLQQGAYILSEAFNGQPRVILIGTGSEVHICLAAQNILQDEGIPTRVVSMPSMELFQQQPDSYRRTVLPPEVHARVAVEAGLRLGWDPFLGPQGRFVGMSRFGASAPHAELYRYFGLTAAHVAEVARQTRQSLT